MKRKEKYVFLSELFDEYDPECIKKNYNSVKELSNDFSPQIRGLVAKVCSAYESPETLDVLLFLSQDPNELVRLQVADALCCFEDNLAYQKLVELCNDSYYMVRGYAEYGVGFVGAKHSKRRKQAMEIVRGKLKEERLYFNRLQCYMAMYFLGDNNSLSEILMVYHLLKYQNKCMVLRFMIDIFSAQNCEKIVGFFSNIDKSGIPAVDLLIDELLKKEF